MSLIFCANCKRRLSPSEARVVIKGRWWCGECAYYQERGELNPRTGK